MIVATARPRWIPVIDVAQLVRNALKARIPGTRFSVRAYTYDDGSALHVSWMDGPVSRSVTNVIGPYAGARFDSRYQLAYGTTTWLCPRDGVRVAEAFGHSINELNGPVDSRCCHQAELVEMGADYVFTDRQLSPDFRAELAATLTARTGLPYDPHVRVGGEYMSTHLHQLSADTERAA